MKILLQGGIRIDARFHPFYDEEVMPEKRVSATNIRRHPPV